MKRELGLSDEQSKQFNNKKESFMNTMKPRWEQVNQLKDSLYRHLGDEQVPDPVVNYYTTKWMEKTRENDQLLFHHFRDLRKYCKQDQLQKFDTIVSKMVTRRYRK